MHWSLSSFRAAGIKDRPSKAIFGCWLLKKINLYELSNIFTNAKTCRASTMKKRTMDVKQRLQLRQSSRKKIGTSKVLSLVQSSLSLPSFPPNIEPHHVYLHPPRMMSNTQFIGSLSLSLSTFLCTSYLWHLIIWITLTHKGHYMGFLWIIDMWNVNKKYRPHPFQPITFSINHIL